MHNHIKEFFDRNSVDRHSPVPLHYQLKNLILIGIKEGTLTPGDCLPTEFNFSNIFNISRTTVRQALTTLVSEGFLYRVKSKGTFIAQTKIDLHYMMGIESFNSQITNSGMVPKTKVLKRSLEKADEEIASLLSIDTGDKIIKLIRLRYADDNPIVIAESYHPMDICSELLSHDLETESLLEVLSLKAESQVVRVKRTIEAIGASTEDGTLLEVDPGFPLQSFKNISYNKNGRIVEYCFSRYRGDKNKFSVEILKNTECN